MGDSIGIELEFIEQEKNVGPFRADIICKNTLDDHFVLIENQLEKTDHTHLGQLLTYAAGLDAVTIIWIAKQFTEEHRAAIDWLNRITDEKFNFFGIEIEVYKIGDSLPAPLFQIISKPNDWAKSVKSSASSNQGLTKTKEINLEYWTQFKAYLESVKTSLKGQKPQPQHWTNFATGKANFYIAATVSVRDNFLRVEFLIDGSNSKNNFRLLKEKYEAESYVEIDEKLGWEEMPDKRVSSVYLKKDYDIKNKAQWKSQHEWLKDTLEKFDEFFRNKIKSM
ncbi:MAG: DUF4268 domain-containing protein [Mariniphaga sp.]